MNHIMLYYQSHVLLSQFFPHRMPLNHIDIFNSCHHDIQIDAYAWIHRGAYG